MVLLTVFSYKYRWEPLFRILSVRKTKILLLLYALRVTGFALPVARYVLRFTRYVLRVACLEPGEPCCVLFVLIVYRLLHVASCASPAVWLFTVLRVACCALLVARCVLRVACCALCVAYPYKNSAELSAW